MNGEMMGPTEQEAEDSVFLETSRADSVETLCCPEIAPSAPPHCGE